MLQRNRGQGSAFVGVFLFVGNFVSTSSVVPWLQVELPGDTMKDLDLDVQKTKLTVQSKKQ